MDGGRHMRQVLGRSFFLLVADLRRSGTRIGRGSFYFRGRAFLRGSGPRPASRRPDRRGLRARKLPRMDLAHVRSRPLPVVFF